MNNEILQLMQDFIMSVKHEHNDNPDIQRIAEKLDDAIDREFAVSDNRNIVKRGDNETS